jgi:hypothetical protein
LFRNDKELNEAQLTQLLEASRRVADGQTFKVLLLLTAMDVAALARGDQVVSHRYDIQMGPSGRPRYLDEKTARVGFEEFTGQRARRCTGELLSEELVVDYTTDDEGLNPVDVPKDKRDGGFDDGAGGRIKVVVHERDANDLLAEVFETYAGERRLTIGPRATVDGHVARPLIARNKARPSDLQNPPPPARELEDWLWVDVESLFIVRWEVRASGVAFGYGYDFIHAPGLTLHPPAVPKGVKIPICIQ